jgi:hypothetical protein
MAKELAADLDAKRTLYVNEMRALMAALRARTWKKSACCR